MTKHKKFERLRWGCRRGMLELDILLLPFFDNNFKDLSPSEQAEFEQLLATQDQLLYEWLMGTSMPEEPTLQALIKKIKKYAQIKP